jgi:hypothetical protein
MNVLLNCVVLALLGGTTETDGCPAIILHNPTRSRAPAVVEIPTGRLAAPGLIQWDSVQLVSGDELIPFAIRSGGFPWQNEIALGTKKPPRAEDLLVFVCSVNPGATKRVTIVEGVSLPRDPVVRTDDRVIVEFPAVRAAFDESTGCLTELNMRGVPVLDGPLSVTFQRLQAPAYTVEGSLGPGYQTPRIVINPTGDTLHEVKFIGVVSSGALVEARWLLARAGGPEVLLTYRVYSHGMVEMIADDRTWEGPSPWVSHAVNWTLPLRGAARAIPLLETRFPFYGFKDFTASFPQVGRIWEQDDGSLVEIGEQAINGRRFYRKLLPFQRAESDGVGDFIELMDEGLVVLTDPASIPLAHEVSVSGPPQAQTVVEKLKGVLERYDRTATVTKNRRANDIQLILKTDAQDLGIMGDGFTIRRRKDGRVDVVAGTLLGLRQAIRAIDDHLSLHGSEAGVPQVAASPIVPLRGGGFGGGKFEVDFPYGSLSEWEYVLDELLDSGMNVLTCLGMWGNWKMPVGYRYMPELVSDDPEAYDESSGTLFSEIESQRKRGLHLLKYVQDQGGQVWLWLPIGCVPTTFSTTFPEAMMPGAIEEFWGRPKGTPCFTHERYHAYLDALIRELVETYPVDGIMLVRDDNGKLCSCDRCQRFVAESRTHHAAWEQYLLIYDRLKAWHFKGCVAVYPYFDGYTADLEDVLPPDLYVVGHGASVAGLTRRYDRVGHMPDTWLDSLFTNFRLPSTPRVRRLLSDRSTFWIGGAYCGTELPWVSIGQFGWEPTTTPNTLRFLWGARRFGAEYASMLLTVSNLYEDLWEINARYMVPKTWLETPAAQRTEVLTETLAKLGHYETALRNLRDSVGKDDQARWFGHMELLIPLLRYQLHRLDRFAANHDLIAPYRQEVVSGTGLPPDVRDAVLRNYAMIYQYANVYDQSLLTASGAMLEATRAMTMPYKEWMAGYDVWLDPHLKLPQFAGEISGRISEFQLGQRFTLNVTLRNTGMCPWIAQAKQRIVLEGIAKEIGLPHALDYEGEPIAPGDSRSISIEGRAPQKAVHGKLTIGFYSPSRVKTKIAEASVELGSR